MVCARLAGCGDRERLIGVADPIELHLHRLIKRPYETVEARLAGGPERWLPGFAFSRGRVTGELSYEQAGALIRRRIEVHVGPVQRFAYGVTVQVGWKGAQHPELYPQLDGHLRLEPQQPTGTTLRFDARYTPPAGRLGATINRAVMHRVAESTVDGFLTRVVEQLASD